MSESKNTIDTRSVEELMASIDALSDRIKQAEERLLPCLVVSPVVEPLCVTVYEKGGGGYEVTFSIGRVRIKAVLPSKGYCESFCRSLREAADNLALATLNDR